MPTSERISLLLFLFVVTAVYILELFFILTFVITKLGRGRTTNILWRKPAIVIHLLAIVGIICFLYGYFIEPYWVEVKVVPIETDKLKKTSFRLVQISDLHCDKKERNEERIIGLINQMAPDIIVFTGDAINTASALVLFKDTMRDLNAGLAKLAIRGNFEVDYWKNLDLFSDTGFEVLDEKTVVLRKDGETICISGLTCENPSAFRGLLQSVPDGHYSVFLYHFSDLVEDLEGLNVDLYLCGHTHGGQVALPVYGAVITLSKYGKKYESGMYTVGDTILYVNRGIGLETGLAPKVRFFARPEITVFDIGPRKQSLP
jgi:predicted MPP superfamily phosphohydrolase